VPAPDRSLFADRLRTELRALRLSQAALAEQLGVSQQTVSKWLTGETQPRVKLLPALAEALGMEPTDLSAALVARAEPKSLDEAMELRVAALDRRIRDLTPAQMDRLEAYIRGLRDGAGSA
jgi:transcriptional regulator with XRE-family HTH domain